MPKQKFRSREEPIIIPPKIDLYKRFDPPKIDLDKRLDPVFIPDLNEAINELIFRTRNALISHYNSESGMRQEIIENRKEIDELQELVEILRKQQPHQKRKSSLKIKDKKKLR